VKSRRLLLALATFGVAAMSYAAVLSVLVIRGDGDGGASAPPVSALADSVGSAGGLP
jgi:hypothetical protein